MTFDEVLDQVRELLQQRNRVTYRSLKRRFDLDDEYLEDLKGELIRAEGVAVDEDGDVLVWVGKEKGQETEKRRSGKVEQEQIAALDARSQLLDSRPPEGERRQLTVQFIDLVGSTTLSQQLDPEELRDVVRAYHETCADAIRRYGGHMAQHLGDGLLVYFGYPTAHEDDAQRAVHTGLEILLGLQQLNDQLPSTTRARLPHPLQVRIGIHTGLVVVGAIGSSEKHEILALGETPNLAARIQGQAEPDTVLISAATYHLIEGLFECEDYGQPELKGVAIPLRLYRVLRAGEAQSRFQVVARKGLTPLVGREHEYGLLRERWGQVKDGAGQVVLLSGEPGIGKSRLVEVLRETVEHEGARCFELRCSPYHQNSALYPVIEHLQRVLKFRSEDSPEEKLHKLVGLSHASLLQTEAIPLLAALLSLPHPEGSLPLTVSPQKQKEKTSEALVAWLCEEARQQAVVYAWEDLHWADPSTLELLTLLLAQVPTTRLLVMLTFRPEFTSPWDTRSYLSQFTLSRLDRTQVAMMVERVTGGKTLPAEVVRQIASKTDGVPLFVEELTKTVVESGLLREAEGHYELTGPLPPLAIPSTLQDSLMARLDRLAAVREVAQLGATLGREFSAELIQAVSSLDTQTLQNGLSQLVGAELIYQRGVGAQAHYVFKHALIQDAAYQSLLKSRRQQLHQQIAQVLAERFPETTETQPELLAHHYTEAGLSPQAIPYWQKAGERAAQRSANVEAISHLTKGLESLKTLPNTPERIEQELDFQVTLGSILMATKGFAAPEVESAYARARELCQQVGETPHLFTALLGMRLFYGARAKHKTACEIGEQCLRIAEKIQDPTFLLGAHHALGDTLYWTGDFVLARAHQEQAIALYNPRLHRALNFGQGYDLGMDARAHAAWVLWYLGYPNQALQRSHEALTLAGKLAHPFSLAHALDCAAWLLQLRREEQAVKERAEAAILLATEHGFAMEAAWGTTLRGWALAAQGQREEGIAQVRQGLTAWQATEAELFLPWWLAFLAQAYGQVGQTEEGLTILTEALAKADKNGERFYEAELYRLRGELRLQLRAQEKAEEDFRQAITLARRQHAKSWELRAVMSLSRLWQSQGKKEEAHRLLTEIYGWFTEGFDTKDLQEAKAILNELS